MSTRYFVDHIEGYFKSKCEKLAELVRHEKRLPEFDIREPIPPRFAEIFCGLIPPDVARKQGLFELVKGKPEKITVKGCVKKLEEYARSVSRESGLDRVGSYLGSILVRLHELAAIRAGNTIWRGAPERNKCFDNPKEMIYEKLGPELWDYYQAASPDAECTLILTKGLKKPPSDAEAAEYGRGPEFLRFRIVNQLRAIREYLGLLPEARGTVTEDLLSGIERRAKEAAK